MRNIALALLIAISATQVMSSDAPKLLIDLVNQNYTFFELYSDRSSICKIQIKTFDKEGAENRSCKYFMENRNKFLDAVDLYLTADETERDNGKFNQYSPAEKLRIRKFVAFMSAGLEDASYIKAALE